MKTPLIPLSSPSSGVFKTLELGDSEGCHGAHEADAATTEGPDPHGGGGTFTLPDGTDPRVFHEVPNLFSHGFLGILGDVLYVIHLQNIGLLAGGGLGKLKHSQIC